MNLIINGKSEDIGNAKTIADLLKLLSVNLPKFFAIEKNKKIIYKEDYENEALSENDEIEVVIFAGGG